MEQARLFPGEVSEFCRRKPDSRTAFSISPTSQRSWWMDHLLSRSDKSMELVDLRKQSQNSMKRFLNWWELLTWFGFGAVIGVGFFVLSRQEANDHAGPAIVLSYVAPGISAMLSLLLHSVR